MTMHKLMAVFSLTLFLSVHALAENSGTEKLKQFVKTVNTFEAHFEQTVIDSEGNILEQAEGQFQLSRPGKFRWDYHQPYPQHIVADGQQIWFYDVDLEQVTVRSQQEALAETPATLLSGDLIPEDSYHIENLPSDDGLSWVELTPKDTETNFQSVSLAFDGGTLNQMIMHDSFGQRTRLAFSQVRENPGFAEDVFAFTPPEGIDVVGDTQ